MWVRTKHLGMWIMWTCDWRSLCSICGIRQQALCEFVTDKQLAEQRLVLESKPERWAGLDLHLRWSAADTEMKRMKSDRFALGDLQVPFLSTWGTDPSRSITARFQTGEREQLALLCSSSFPFGSLRGGGGKREEAEKWQIKEGMKDANWCKEGTL